MDNGCIMSISVEIREDLIAYVYIRGKLVITSAANEEGLTQVLAKVDQLKLCPGVKVTEGTVNVYSTEKWFLEVINKEGTARSIDCRQFVNLTGQSCPLCLEVKDILQKYSRPSTNALHRNAPISKVKDTSLLQQAVLQSRQQNQKLEQELARIKATVQSDAVEVDLPLHEDLSNFYGNSGVIEKVDPMVRLFWQEQTKAFGRQNKGMRWHPMLIKFAVCVRQMSPALYAFLRETGVLKLPGESTLRDYTGVLVTTPGFQTHVIKQLQTQAGTLQPHDRYVCLLHDEMTIMSDLVFDQKTGQLVGFVSPEQFDQEKGISGNIAKQVLMFMVIGVTTGIKASIGYFGTTCTSAGWLYFYLWEAVMYLELTCGLKVIASTSDKAAPNMRMYSMHSDSTHVQGVAYKSLNLYADGKRPLYFISDAPHLLKTLRNNLHGSGFHGHKKVLQVNGSFLLWSHVKQLWEKDIEGDLYKTKLTYDHVNLTPKSTMKVKLAAQVMSESVAKVLSAYGDDSVQETSRLLHLVDKWFDCMNVRHISEAGQKRKPFLQPYSSAEDERLQWLKEVFLEYFVSWKGQMEALPGKAADKKKTFISDQTFKGLVMTVHSMTEVIHFLLGEGVQYILTNKFCQDPIEEAFGKHRAIGRRADNMTLHNFGQQECRMHLQGQWLQDVKPRGNVTNESTKILKVVSDEKLAKLKKPRK